ncbi:unnamed protein product [Meloidogyne enterolobii]|uniref:Uncharacterized protein n=1 Tax=Meloidogyne enterolobii TaxID=390850 RepID=A0ACB0YMM6_MELEN
MFIRMISGRPRISVLRFCTSMFLIRMCRVEKNGVSKFSFDGFFFENRSAFLSIRLSMIPAETLVSIYIRVLLSIYDSMLINFICFYIFLFPYHYLPLDIMKGDRKEKFCLQIFGICLQRSSALVKQNSSKTNATLVKQIFLKSFLYSFIFFSFYVAQFVFSFYFYEFLIDPYLNIIL